MHGTAHNQSANLEPKQEGAQIFSLVCSQLSLDRPNWPIEPIPNRRFSKQALGKPPPVGVDRQQPEAVLCSWRTRRQLLELSIFQYTQAAQQNFLRLGVHACAVARYDVLFIEKKGISSTPNDSTPTRSQRGWSHVQHPVPQPQIIIQNPTNDSHLNHSFAINHGIKPLK